MLQMYQCYILFPEGYGVGAVRWHGAIAGTDA